MFSDLTVLARDVDMILIRLEHFCDWRSTELICDRTRVILDNLIYSLQCIFYGTYKNVVSDSICLDVNYKGNHNELFSISLEIDQKWCQGGCEFWNCTLTWFLYKNVSPSSVFSNFSFMTLWYSHFIRGIKFHARGSECSLLPKLLH